VSAGVRRLSRGRAGFTLVEVMIAVAILGVLVMLAIPFFRGALQEEHLSRATRSMVGDLNLARSYALAQTQVPTGGPPFPVSNAGINVTGGASYDVVAWDINNNVLILKTVNLRQDDANTQLQIAVDVGTQVRFRSDGTPVAARNVQITDPSAANRQHLIQISLAGSIRQTQ
jgi:type IV fimbrial biogenesis protein FimT